MAINRDRRRAPRLLATAPNGPTEATMLAHGFTNAMLDAMVRDGLATATPEIVHAGEAADRGCPYADRRLQFKISFDCHF
jgi:hypothetical protein